MIDYIPPPGEPKPLVPRWLAALLAVVASAGAFAAGSLQAPASWMVAGLALLAAVVAGVTGFKVPAFTVGRPLVQASLVGPLAGAVVPLVDMAAQLPEGPVRGCMLVAAILCAGLAGIPLPRPTR